MALYLWWTATPLTGGINNINPNGHLRRLDILKGRIDPPLFMEFVAAKRCGDRDDEKGEEEWYASLGGWPILTSLSGANPKEYKILNAQQFRYPCPTR